MKGEGVTQDDHRGVSLFANAAAQAYPRAEEALAWAYENGRGVPRDLDYANKWIQTAARHGSQSAQRRIERADKGRKLLIAFLKTYSKSNSPQQCDTFYGFSCNRGADMPGLDIFMSIKGP